MQGTGSDHGVIAVGFSVDYNPVDVSEKAY